MRIAVIAPPWLPIPPGAYGGTESLIDTQCRGLVAAGHDVLLIASGDSTCPVELAARSGTAIGMRSMSAAAELAHAAFGYDVAARWGADVVHDHTLAGPLLGTRSFAHPVVTTAHGPLGGELGPLFRTTSRHVAVVAISHAQAADALAGTRIARVVHHGLDVASYPFGAEVGDTAVFLGRMSPDKGIDRAIAVARAADVPLVIAAKMREPREREYFEAVIRRRLGRGVEYIGEVDRQGIGPLLAGARCLLNPIRWPEPFGLVAIEALACGTPVVTTPYGAMPEIVADGRVGFVRRGVEELADAVRCATSIDRTACRHHVEERFSMGRMADDHVELYRTLIAAASRRRTA